MRASTSEGSLVAVESEERKRRNFLNLSVHRHICHTSHTHTHTPHAHTHHAHTHTTNDRQGRKSERALYCRRLLY